MLSKIREKGTRLASLFGSGRYPQAIGYASKFVLGYSLYTKHLATYFASDQLPVAVHGNIMYLSPADPGMSTELFHFGTHEPGATKIFRQQMDQLLQSTENPTVFDIGAHRGYYAFQAADIFGDSGTVYAFEPDTTNFDALTRGIESNGFKNIHAQRCAFGSENTTGELNISNRSNSHTLTDTTSTDRKYTDETVSTDIYSIDSYLADSRISPHDVDFVKIDVEGFEAEVFEGMEELLNRNSELMLFVELHPHRVEPAKLQSIVEDINTGGFELIHASSSAAAKLSDYGAVSQHLSVPKGRHSTELLAKRPGKESHAERPRTAET